MGHKLLKVKIFGTVQGVFFRHSARIEFEELGIKGFARNESDGSLSLEAEGKEEALGKLLEWCKKGPPLAKVEKIEFSFHDATGQFKDFEIK